VTQPTPMQRYKGAMNKAVQHLQAAEEMEPGSGGRATEAALAHAYVLWATEFRAAMGVTGDPQL
jgi:hypothetical protein